MKGIDAQFMGGGGEIISNADDVEKKMRNISDEDTDVIHNILQENIYNLPEEELDEFFGKSFFEDFGKSMSKEMFCQILDIFIKYNYINPLESGDAGDLFADEESLLWERIDDYRQFVISKLDFETEENFTQTYAYLTFIDALNIYSELNIDQMSDWPETSKLFYDKIAEGVNNRNSGYFLHLYAKDIQNRHRTQSLDFFEQLNEEGDEFEEEMKNKYGNQWERHVDDELEKERRQSIVVDNIQRPFLIAPHIYAITDNQGFMISKQEDYQKITTLIKELDNLPNTIDDFFQTNIEENFGISSFSDDESEEIIREQITDKEDEILNYFNDELKEDDVLLKNRESGSRFERSDFNDYVALQSSTIRQYIQNGLHINFADLSFNEQFYFLQFAKNTRVNQIDKLREFIGNTSNENHKLNRIKSFLSLEQGGQEMGEKIMSIGENLDQQSADMIFAKYAQLVDTASELRNKIGEFSEKTIVGEDLSAVEGEMLEKAKNLLVEFADRLDELSSDEIFIELEKNRTDLLTTLSIYKALRDKISISELKYIKKEKIGANEMIKNDEILVEIKKQFFETYEQDSKFEFEGNNSVKNGEDNFRLLIEMLNIYKQNWKEYPSRGEEFIQSFFDSMRNDISQLYIYKHKDELMSFMRVDSIDDESVHLASFNSVDTVKGNAIGSALLDDILEMLKNKKNIVAETVLTKRVFPVYLERFSFVASDIKFGDSENQKPVVEINIKPNNNEYQYKKYSSSKLLEEYEKQDLGKKQGNIIACYNLDGDDLYNKLDRMFKMGYVCSRCVFDKKDNKAYFALEIEKIQV